MAWEGYNYEDAILINEKLVKEDALTSIHIEEYESEARDTKWGAGNHEDIPNVGEDALKDMDERGIIYVEGRGTVRDILVESYAEGETELTAEERLFESDFRRKSER